MTQSEPHPDLTTQFATFLVDKLFFGVEVHQVQEVLRAQEMTIIPLAPPVLRGLINLRGQIVAAIDMRQRLGLEPRPAGAEWMNMIVRSGEGATSLLVDEIGDVINVAHDSFDPVPETVPPHLRQLLTGVHKLDNRLLLVLDTERAQQLPPPG